MIYRVGSWSAEFARSALPWVGHALLGASLFVGCASPEPASQQAAPAGGTAPGSSEDATRGPDAPSPSNSNSANSDSANSDSANSSAAPNSAEPSEGSEGASNSADLPLDGTSSEPGATGSGDDPAAQDPEATPADPEVSAPVEPPEPAPVNPADLPPVTLWIAGDSTVANGQTPCPRGWGGVIAARFDERVRVNNAAVGGRSVHTWLYEVGQEKDASGECTLGRDASGAPLLQARWQTMLDGMRPGDYLLIQFGINDGDPNCDRHVGIDAFQTAYGMMAEAAKARGAQPVFLTPVSSISCAGTTARGSRGGFVPATLEAGAEFDVPVIDLHALSVELFNERGFCPVAGGDVSATTTGPVGDFFCDDHTHFSPTGAVEIAALVARGLQSQGIGLASYLK